MKILYPRPREFLQTGFKGTDQNQHSIENTINEVQQKWDIVGATLSVIISVGRNSLIQVPDRVPTGEEGKYKRKENVWEIRADFKIDQKHYWKKPNDVFE